MTRRPPSLVAALACADVLELSFPLADGEVPGGMAEAARTHAARCAPCRAALDRDEGFVRGLRGRAGAAGAAAPEALRARVRRELHAAFRVAR